MTNERWVVRPEDLIVKPKPKRAFSGVRVKYSEDQPRDDHGRFGETSGGDDPVATQAAADVAETIAQVGFLEPPPSVVAAQTNAAAADAADTVLNQGLNSILDRDVPPVAPAIADSLPPPSTATASTPDAVPTRDIAPGVTMNGESASEVVGSNLLNMAEHDNETYSDKGVAGELKTANVEEVSANLVQRADADPELKAQLDAIGERLIADFNEVAPDGRPFDTTLGDREMIVGHLHAEAVTPSGGDDPQPIDARLVLERDDVQLVTGATELGARLIAAEMQDAWMTSASDSNQQSWGLQLAIAEKFGLPTEPVMERMVGQGPANNGGGPTMLSSNIGVSVPEDAGLRTQAIAISESPAIQAYVDSVYERTQMQLAEQEITEMSLYRGVQWEANADPFKAEDIDNVKPSVVDTNLNPLSSFTTSIVTAAQDFGLSWVSAVAGGRAVDGYQLTATVPAERIFSLPTSGPGCLAETECLVIGGPARVEIVSTMTEEQQSRDALQEQAASGNTTAQDLLDVVEAHHPGAAVHDALATELT